MIAVRWMLYLIVDAELPGMTIVKGDDGHAQLPQSSDIW
jgi:hypothetical protein